VLVPDKFNIDFAVAILKTSGVPLPDEFLPKNEAVAMSAILANVTALFAMVARKDPIPDPVTSPVRVIVWSPVFAPLTDEFPLIVSVAPLEGNTSVPVPP